MRRVLATTLGLLSIGSAAFAQDNPWARSSPAPTGANAPAVSLGRPVPAATLGRPAPLSPDLQPAAFQNDTRSAKPQPTPVPLIAEGAPMLAPIDGQPTSLIGAGNQSGKPTTTTDGTPAPLPVPSAVPGGLPQTPCACGGGNPGYITGGYGDGFPGGWGYDPSHSLFGPIFPYVGSWSGRVYASGEFLLWFARGARVPALAITTQVVPTNTVPRPQPETVLFGDGVNDLYPSSRYGARINAGFWFNPNQCRGLDFGFLFLGTATTNYFVSSDQVPIISRPFFNLNRNEPFAEIVAAPGVSTGNLRITGESSLWGMDINYRRGLLRACDGCGRIDGIAGFRYLHLNENVSISETFASTANTNGVPNVSGTVFDQCSTTNDFYGGQIGLLYSRQWGRWSLDGTAKVALGTTTNQVNILGGQNLLLNGVPTVTNAGLLALNSNSGHFVSNAFSVVPEVGINLGYQVTPRLKLFVGYSFLFWSNVVRPGDQIDTGIDVTRIPNFPALDRNGNPITTQVAFRPAVTMTRTDYWAQGINFGLQLKW